VLTGLYNRKELILVDTELDERKRKILKAIIQTYLETGAGRLKNDFQIHGFEFKLRHNPE